MNQISEMDDDLRPEYDFTQLTVVARGQGRKKSNLTVELVVGGLNKPTILNSTSDDDNQIAILWLFAPPSTSGIEVEHCIVQSSDFIKI